MHSLLEDITYYEGGEFPFAGEKVTAAICIETLEYVPNPRQMLSEIFESWMKEELFYFLFPGRQGGTVSHSTSSVIRLKN